MSDAQKAFVFLKDNISSWLNELDDVDVKVIESITHASSTTHASESSTVSRSIKKTGSTESIRPGNANHVAMASNPTEDTEVTQPTTTSNRPVTSPISRDAPLPLPQLLGRKRKTESLYSNRTVEQPERTKYRAHNFLVVWYDSRIQKGFEQLVRNISSGRNMLRKGKMAAKLEALAAEVTEEDDYSEDELEREVLMLGGKIDGPKRPRFPPSFARTRLGPPAIVMGDDDASARFDETDKMLEVAQSLCEKAAHQFLREGDCREETSQAREKLRAALERSKREVELQGERERLAATRRVADGNGMGTPMNKITTPAAPAPAFASVPLASKAGELRASSTNDDGLGLQPPLLIEADDSDGENLPPLPPIRYTRLARPQ